MQRICVLINTAADPVKTRLPTFLPWRIWSFWTHVGGPKQFENAETPPL